MHSRPFLLSNWLFLCAAMVFAMAVIGAITRLTESGLSIVEWKPVTGAIPPLSEDAWQRTFDLYQATPEYRLKNAGMTLVDFKTIYFWEWFHRLWGRMIGVVFALPFLFFWIRGWIPKGYVPKFILLFALGGLQGAIGWFMVMSGLVDRPSVSPYRLALHLSAALTLFSLMIWWALSLREKRNDLGTPAPRFLHFHGWIALLFVSVTIVWGAFTAGLDAGLVYNEFPTMGPGRLIPAEMWAMTPWWINPFENHAAVQFTHRVLAAVTFIIVLSFALRLMRAGYHQHRVVLLAMMAFIQPALGVATLLTQVNITLAVLHQVGAIMLLAATIATLHAITALRTNSDTPEPSVPS